MDEQGRTPSSGEREENAALRRVSAGQSEATATVDTSANESVIPGPVPAPVPAPRRRTKTGCLTCRKRRIKCGEEKPRCHNCIKAKRECEGYTAPVVFKHALGPFGAVYDPRVPASLQMPMAMSLPGQVHGRGTLLPQMHNITGPALNPQQRVLAPRLPAASPSVSVSGSAASATPFLPHHQLSQQQHRHQRQHQHEHQHQHQYQYQQPPLQQQQHHSQSQPSHYASPFLPAVSQAEYVNAPAHSLSPPGVTLTPTSATAQTWHLAGEQAHLPSPLGPETPVLYRHEPGLPGETYTSANTSFSDRQTLMLDSMAMLHPDATGPITPDNIGFYTDDTFQQAQVYYSWDAEQEVRIPTTRIPDDLKDSDYVLEYEKEKEEVDEEEEEEEEEERHVTEEEGYNQLNLILSSAHQDAMRSYNTYLNEPNMLAFYSPSMSSSPLNNPKTARIWVHFMHATGPSISIWERLNAGPTPLYSGPVPASQQGLWGYIMPLLSLKHPALLQSILAMSSLHIARLQQSHYTITFKHYEYALRKVSKAVGLPLPRKQVATLAATLLLAFYEVSAADHTKWDRHVAGAAQLLKEIDFVGMTRDLRAYRRTVNSQKRVWSKPYHIIPPYSYLEDDPYADKESGVDANIVSRLVGTSIDYDMVGSIDIHPKMRKRHFSRKDIENFRLQCDMYWWYLKQDLFQSLVSGNRLHTPFSRWHVCAPRAGLGKSDAIYGSFDHLVLLMGRMMDFGYRDRKRKLKSLDASGRDWHPHPGFFKFMGRFSPKSTTPGGPPSRMGPPPSSGPSQGGQGNEKPMEQGPPMKPMYGMAPTGDPVPPPSAFTSMGESPPYSGYVEDENEVTTLEEAEAEWERILAAYEFYEAQLGEAFAPLPADSTQPISSPFGPAIQFRSHVISVLWVFYYTGRIMLNRLHPCMPPATMMAAFTAAGTTAKFAHMIGRITAGVYYPELYAQEVGNLNPALGGAWTEAALPLFVAGLQYTDATQRDWTIATLRGTAQVTGWQSAEAIATGCESAWVRAATLGRGPAYVQSEESPLAGDYTSKRGGQTDKYIPDSSNYERRFVKVQRHMRAHWAMGLLELEGDLEGLNIDDPPQTPDHR